LTQLSADLSDPLLKLIQKDQAPIDALEVGPWFSPKQIRMYREELPNWSFHFHAMGMNSWIGIIPGAMRRFRSYINASGTPWLSIHMTSLPIGYVWLAVRLGVPLPAPDPNRGTRRLLRQITKLTQNIEVPLLLENMAGLPRINAPFEVRPEWIREILEKTNLGFLLDTAHARIAAHFLDMDVYDYLDQLPLHRIVQIHASGPRMLGGHLRDAHEALQDEDYELISWLLESIKPRVLTLEYIKDGASLWDQLNRLRKILDKGDRNFTKSNSP